MKAVKSNINTLCSKQFKGRGYTFEGDKKAAQFITQQFKKIGITSFPNQSSYYQPYTLPVNTFPGKFSLSINQKKMELGVDYIPAADAGSGQIKDATPFYIDEQIFHNDAILKDFLKINLKGKVVIYNEEYEQQRFTWNRVILEKMLQADGIVVLYKNKFNHSVGRWQLPKPRFYIKKEHFNEKVHSISFESETEMHEHYISQNVIGYIQGKENPEKYIIISAHYDHLGSIGKKCIFPGANDNASGVSMMIEIAKYYTKNPPSNSIVFIGFGSEEAGLVGSKYYVEHPFFPLEQIRFVVNLDLFGSGEDGMMAVNGSVFKKEFQLLEKINNENGYLSKVAQRGKAANSDHYFFSESGVPSFFFYLMGSSWTHYHDVYDKPPLPLSGFKGAYKLIIDFTNALQIEDY
ncbi:M28 family metallopeptidase [Flammeovirga sp. EKP202]|uniref:M28 family metallopeptidase n=1 Tax=Flammeovirga sp. EKP202 TaxID=2770592 RepID=UPI00165FD381|nr:M28 family peptidase [Flammeovirga sp. EKP202]MBD0404188.1 M28 family peptidase [Flammeovirga sp. EKP202]